jgi:hypothetical protein
MRKRCVLGPVLCVVVLGGCAGRAAGDRIAGSAGRPEVRARTGVPETGRFSLEITTNGAGTDLLLSAVGVFDHRTRRYSLEVGGTAATSPATPRRAIAADGVVYLDFPALAQRLGAPTPWISMRGEGGDDVLGLRRLDPTHLLDLASSSDATVERDADGLVRRITMRFDAPGQDGSVVLTVAYTDLGAPVTIEPPRADQVSDETEALSRPEQATGG